MLHRWRVLYAPDAQAYTNVPEHLKQFLRQQLRWKKSWLREIPRAARAVAHKNPIMVVMFSLSVILPLLAPQVVLRAMLVQPRFIDELPFWYFGGVAAIALIYGMFYRMNKPAKALVSRHLLHPVLHHHPGAADAVCDGHHPRLQVGDTMNPKPRKKCWAPIYSVILTLLSTAVVAAYLILPGMWQWNRAAMRAETHGTSRPAVQVDTVSGPVDPALVAKLASLSTSPQAPPLILTYHDIGHTKDRYTVTPENFAVQMRMIHDAGWTTLTANDLSRWLAGEPMPPHGVFITFDDGTRGVWQYADPVLKRYGLHAMTFIITGFVATHAPYYMTWDQIHELQNSGRWDVEAHTHLGHVQVPSDANGHEGAFLTTAQWLPAQNRVQTDEEYYARVQGDLTECKHQFVLHNLPEPRFLAYPFSAHEDAENPARAAMLSSIVTPLIRPPCSIRPTLSR